MATNVQEPNASLQLLPKAGATQERRLEAVSCKALLAGATASSTFQCLQRLRKRLSPVHHESLARDKARLIRG